MLFVLPIAIVGYAVIANVDNPHVKYGMTFLMATGMYASVPCILVWNSNNSAGHYKRATTSAMQLAIANCGGFVASKIHLSKNFQLQVDWLSLNSIQLSHERRTTIPSWAHYHSWPAGIFMVHVSRITTSGLSVANNPPCRILFNVLYCAKINKDKRRGKYDQYRGYNDDRDPAFVMILWTWSYLFTAQDMWSAFGWSL